MSFVIIRYYRIHKQHNLWIVLLFESKISDNSAIVHSFKVSWRSPELILNYSFIFSRVATAHGNTTLRSLRQESTLQ